MKVFISHSSQDRWIARRVSEDLEARGIETFLDEKHMETGESIDGSIAQHLRQCDEVVMLLSPPAVNSQWVLIEIGGARALEKRLIPILLHIGVNEMPQLLSKSLARDINDIDRYYDEATKRAKGMVEPTKPEPVTHPRRRESPPEDLKIGDKVRIVEVDLLTEEDKASPPSWLSEMDRYSGKDATILKFLNSETVTLDIDGEKAGWATRWLIKL